MPVSSRIPVISTESIVRLQAKRAQTGFRNLSYVRFWAPAAGRDMQELACETERQKSPK